MKTKNILITFVLTIALFNACHDDLNVIQKSAISSSSMWQDEGDAKSAMHGLYNQYRSTYSSGLMYWGEYRTGLWGDGLTGTTSNDQVYQNQIPTNHGFADWGSLYTTINDANLILKYVPEIAFNNEEQKNKILANAYYVRAFSYYWIARIWGDAPLLLTGFESDKQDDLFPLRKPVAEILKQVGDDIDNGLKLIPLSIKDRNLASLASLNMLKADYCLWMYKVRNGGEDMLTNAQTALTSVLNDSDYKLETNYESIFSNELGNEIIFAWSYIQDEYTGGYPSDYLVPSQYVSASAIENPVKVGSHQQWTFYTVDYKSFLSNNADDQRTIVSFETYFDEPKNTTFQWINKFSGTWMNGTRLFDSVIIVYRYADALLLDAEVKLAKNDLAGAANSLNKIAKRAYNKENFYSANVSPQIMLENILIERMKEFGAEGKLWWDYIRMGVVFEKAPYLKGRENEENVLLWPVSQNSINRNPNIKQTPGYDK